MKQKKQQTSSGPKVRVTPMSLLKTTQAPLSIGKASKRDVRTQFAAICYRVRKDETQILLVTSRGTGRWILPKGWPMDGLTPAAAAAQEAWEEAGVIGKLKNVCIGIYSSIKVLDDGEEAPCVVAVFPIRVKSLSDDFPEAGQRKRKWFSAKKAASLVLEPELKHLLRKFDHRLMG